MAGCASDLVTDLWILLGLRCLQRRVVLKMSGQEHCNTTRKKIRLFCRLNVDYILFPFLAGVNTVESINLSNPAEVTRMLQLATRIETDERTSEHNETEEDNEVGIEPSDGIDFDREESASIGNPKDFSEHINETTDPGNEENIENPTYLVERLLDMKVIRKKTHYLVKWRGFPEPTWEPHENIPFHIKRNFNKEKRK